MQKTAKGQITLVSLSDGSSSMFFISPNISTQQIYDSSNGSYVPNYTTSHLVLTPKLSIGGVPVTGASYVWKSGSSNLGTDNQLTISENLTSEQKVITCTATYTDPNNGSVCEAEAYCVISRITTAGADVNVLLDPDGLNYVDQTNEAVTLKATAYYGSANKDNSNANDGILYKWSIYNFTYNDFCGFSSKAQVPTGCTDINNANAYNTSLYFKKDEDSDYGFATGTADDYVIKINNNTIEIKADAIDVKETIKCEATVYAVSNNKVTQTLGTDSDIETVRDLTDIYTVGISATTNALTSNVQASKLTATLFQNGIDVTTKMQPSYDWDAYTVHSTTGESTVAWDEYFKDGNNYTPMQPGDPEKGTGYWILGDYRNPDKAEFTGNREVTVYRQWVGNASNIECKLTW